LCSKHDTTVRGAECHRTIPSCAAGFLGVPGHNVGAVTTDQPTFVMIPASYSVGMCSATRRRSYKGVSLRFNVRRLDIGHHLSISALWKAASASLPPWLQGLPYGSTRFVANAYIRSGCVLRSSRRPLGLRLGSRHDATSGFKLVEHSVLLV